MAKFCGNCGTPCEEGMKFCRNCGAKLELFDGAEEKKPLTEEKPPVNESVAHTQEQPRTNLQNNPANRSRQTTYADQKTREFGSIPQKKPAKREPYYDDDLPPKKSSKAPAVIICSVLALILILGSVFFLHMLGFIKIQFLDDIIRPKQAAEPATEIVATVPATETVAPTAAPTERPTQTPKVKVTNGINRKFEAVKADMEGLGLKVKMVEKESATVEKGKVISQDIEPGTLVEPGTTVTLNVSKGGSKSGSKESSSDITEDYQQKLVVHNTGGSSAVAELMELENGSWKKKASYNAVVGANGVGKAGEGSRRTPEGKFKLGVVLSESMPDTEMTWYKASDSTVIVDDVNFPALYNHIMEKSAVPKGCSSDPTGKNLTNGTLSAMIFIEFNGNGFSQAEDIGGGSAIGLRGAYSLGGGTYGDVDISASDMDDLLSRLDPAKNPHIEIY